MSTLLIVIFWIGGFLAYGIYVLSVKQIDVRYPKYGINPPDYIRGTVKNIHAAGSIAASIGIGINGYFSNWWSGAFSFDAGMVIALLGVMTIFITSLFGKRER